MGLFWTIVTFTLVVGVYATVGFAILRIFGLGHRHAHH